jgi:hypothetical protein
MCQHLLRAAKGLVWLLSPNQGPLGFVLLGVFIEIPALAWYDGKVSIADIPAMWLAATQALAAWFGIELLGTLLVLGAFWLIHRRRPRPCR